MFPKTCIKIPESAGKPYMPSNGTEGMIWMTSFCDQCIHENPDPESEHKCDYITDAMCLGEQPRDWVYNSEGWPVCLKWRKYDWGNDDDPNDPNNPKAPIPDDPNQLLMPFDIWELLGVSEDVIVTKTAILEKQN